MEQAGGPRRWVVSPEELLELGKAEGIRVIDARRAAPYARSHVGGAVSLPLSKLLFWSGQSAQLPRRDEIENLVGSLEVSKEDQTVVYDDHRGLHASRVAWTLEHFGYTSVSVLDRDFASLEETNLVVEAPASRRTARPAEKASENVVSKEEILSTLGKNEATVIDCREPGSFSLGHIPGALNLPWYTLSGHGRNFVSPAEILINVGSLRLEGKQIVLYCSSGLNSAHTYVALKSAGLKNVRLYATTYGEWTGCGAAVERGWPTPKEPEE